MFVQTRVLHSVSIPGQSVAVVHATGAGMPPVPLELDVEVAPPAPDELALDVEVALPAPEELAPLVTPPLPDEVLPELW
jgi:hypothetical protein